MAEMLKNPDFTGPEGDSQWMRLALEQARLGAEAGEVPVGALVIKDGEILASAHNRNLLDHDPTAHAEMIALRQAGRAIGRQQRA